MAGREGPAKPQANVAGLQTVAEGRVFLALRAELEKRVRAGGIFREVIAPEVLAQIGTTRSPDGERLLREVTKKQRERIAAIRVPPPEV